MIALGLVQANYISFAHIIECDSNIFRQKSRQISHDLWNEGFFLAFKLAIDS